MNDELRARLTEAQGAYRETVEAPSKSDVAQGYRSDFEEKFGALVDDENYGLMANGLAEEVLDRIEQGGIYSPRHIHGNDLTILVSVPEVRAEVKNVVTEGVKSMLADRYVEQRSEEVSEERAFEVCLDTYINLVKRLADTDSGICSLDFMKQSEFAEQAFRNIGLVLPNDDDNPEIDPNWGATWLHSRGERVINVSFPERD